MPQAANLQEAYANLDPLSPLEGESMRQFYASRPAHASIDFLINELLIDPSSDDKTLFTGHRGSGKTTELARLETCLSETHTVIRFDIERRVNLGDVDYADLLLALGLEVYRHSQMIDVKLDEKKVEDLRFWYETYVLEEDEKRRFKTEAGAGLNALIGNVSLKLSTELPRRLTVRREAHANLSNLIERLNDLLQNFQEKTDRRVLVIVDGLDKVYHLGKVSDLFINGINALVAPQCRIIYTIPFALYNTNDFQQVRLSFSRNVVLSNVKVWEKDDGACDEGREFLKRVLEKRLAENVISNSAKELLVESCGGLIKEMIALARNSVVKALTKRGAGGCIEAEDVEYAARQVRNTYSGLLTEEHYKELWRINCGGVFLNGPLARELLHNLSLLQYNGNDAWWAVHPIIRPLVLNWGEKTGAKKQQ